MLALLPRTLPAFDILADDVGARRPADLAAALDVSTRTAQRWMATGQAPRPACLALFSVSRWGRSEAETRAYNDAARAWQYRAITERENAALRAEISRLCALGHWGCANDVSQLGQSRA
jgi:hypothetical protein